MGKILFCLLGGIAICSGCASRHELSQDDKMSGFLSPWVGRSIAEYIGERGAPGTIVPLSETKKMFQWTLVNQSNAVTIPINGIVITEPSQTLVCRVTFTAKAAKSDLPLDRWLIESYQWVGAC